MGGIDFFEVMNMEALVLPHKLTLDERKKLTVTGVTEVLSFDENYVLLTTTLGKLEIQGEQLSVKNLSLDGGLFTVEGEISALYYTQSREKRSFWERLSR